MTVSDRSDRALTDRATSRSAHSDRNTSDPHPSDRDTSHPAIVRLALLTGLLLTTGCTLSSDRPGQPHPVDPNATPEAVSLYRKLHAISGSHTLFGHHNTLAYGYRWENEPGRSDVKDVTGSYPALFGWDVAALFPRSPGNEEEQERLRQEAFERELDYARRSVEGGGVITYSWHMANPLTGESFYDTTPAIHSMLPGGERHEAYKAELDRLAELFQAIAPHPIIYRPFHEHNGDWFWWCKPFTSEQDFIALWRFTYHYLQEEKGLHHLLWAFSPDRSRLPLETLKEDYFWGYPGDEYIDILGLDNYWDLGHSANTASEEQQRADFVTSLTMMGELAQERGKLTALTEAGYEAIPDPQWWTGRVLPALEANAMAGRSVYFMVWRNANLARDKRDHYYAPFPGQVSAEDFIRFKQSERILFEEEYAAISNP